jgi:hypothetical protein
VSTRTKIDWAAAKTAFVSDPQRSFLRVSRQFSVSTVSVRKHAKRDGWEAAARKFDEEAAARALKAAVKTRDEHIAVALQVRDEVFQAALEAVLAKTLKPAISDLPAIGKYAELLTGEATERTDWRGEMREFASVLFVRLAGLIEPARRPEYLAIVKEVQGQLPTGGEE